MQTPDSAEQNIDKIAALLPNCVTETTDTQGNIKHVIDFNKLKQELSNAVIDDREQRYEFTWPDKRKAGLLAGSPIRMTLRPCREESVDFDTTHNLYIEGDNLDVLKCLKETYLGKVKIIYIDPPYNTGNDFVYHDSFTSSVEEYATQSGQRDEEGNRLVTNLESNGRFHTDWLNMIYPRLKAARDLLADDGVIFISIDDHEAANLKKVCDEVFGERNFVATINLRRSGGRQDSKYYAIVNEYIICCAKNINFFEAGEELKHGDVYPKYDEERKRFYKTQLLRKWGANSLRENRPNLYYPIKGPNGIDVYPIIYDGTTRCTKRVQGRWRWSIERTKKAQAEGLIEFQKNKCGEWVAYEKIFAPIVGEGKTKKYNTWIDDVGNGTSSVKELFSKTVFDYSKSVELIIRFLNMANVEGNSIILDFFSGSATTAHAVMQLNAEDGGNRRYIMVQIPEACKGGSEAAKAGYKTICEIGKERIRRAGKKIKEELTAKHEKEGMFKEESMPPLDTGFRVLKLDTTNMKDVYYRPQDVSQNDLFDYVDNVKEDRNAEDLLFQVMLECGTTLDSQIEREEIEGKTVYNVNHDFLLACFDKNVTDSVVTAIAKRHPTYAIFRDASLDSDAAATNIDELFKTYSNNTIRRVI